MDRLLSKTAEFTNPGNVREQAAEATASSTLAAAATKFAHDVGDPARQHHFALVQIGKAAENVPGAKGIRWPIAYRSAERLPILGSISVLSRLTPRADISVLALAGFHSFFCVFQALNVFSPNRLVPRPPGAKYADLRIAQ
jgi:hypothetical protein